MNSEGIVFNRALQLLPFLNLFERRGGERGPILEAAGLKPSDLSDPAALITGNALYRAVEEMAGALDDPYFAARAAETFVKAGPVFVRESYAASHTLAEFLPLAILELDRQISNIRYSLQVKADVTLVLGERAFNPKAPIVQADAAVASIWITLLRLVVAENFEPSRVLVMAKNNAGIPPDLLPRSSFLKRDWNGVQIRFPSAWLTRPMALDWKIPPTRRGEFPNTSPENAIMIWVEKICLQRIGEGSFGLEDLARHIGVHPKSLQRTLAGLGTSFQQIRDNVRRKKALEILATDKLIQHEDIAEALGFSGATSFSRAFKRWTGKTPSNYRENQ